MGDAVNKTKRVVGLLFWDHSHMPGDENRPILCSLVGQIYKEDQLCYYVGVWATEDGAYNDQNAETFSILKSTVVQRFEAELKEVKGFSRGSKSRR